MSNAQTANEMPSHNKRRLHRVHKAIMPQAGQIYAAIEWSKNQMTPDPSITRLTLNGTLYAVNTNNLILALLAGRKIKH